MRRERKFNVATNAKDGVGVVHGDVDHASTSMSASRPRKAANVAASASKKIAPRPVSHLSANDKKAIDARLERLFAVVSPKGATIYSELCMIIAMARRQKLHPLLTRSTAQVQALSTLAKSAKKVRAALDNPLCIEAIALMEHMEDRRCESGTMLAHFIYCADNLSTISETAIEFAKKPRGGQDDAALQFLGEEIANCLTRHELEVTHHPDGIYQQCLRILLPLLYDIKPDDDPEAEEKMASSVVRRRQQLQKKQKR